MKTNTNKSEIEEMSEEVRKLTAEVVDYDVLRGELLTLINTVFTFNEKDDLSCLREPREAITDFLSVCDQGDGNELLSNLAEYVKIVERKYRWVPEFLGLYHAEELPESKQVNMWCEHHSTGEPFGFRVESEEIPD